MFSPDPNSSARTSASSSNSGKSSTSGRSSTTSSRTSTPVAIGAESNRNPSPSMLSFTASSDVVVAPVDEVAPACLTSRRTPEW